MNKLLLLTKTLLAVALLCVGQNAWGDEWSVDFGAIISAEGLADKTDVYASTESTVTIGGTTMGTVTLGSTAVNANFVMQTNEKWLARTGGYIHNQSGGTRSFAIRNCLAGQIIILRVGNATVNSATNATLLFGENGVNIYKVIADGDVKISHAKTLYIYSVKVLNSYTITDESFPFTSSFGTNSNPFVGANYNVSGTNVNSLLRVHNSGAVALFDTSESPSGKYTVKEGEKLTISYTAYNGYYSSGTIGVSIKNSDGVVLAGYTYSGGAIQSLTIGGNAIAAETVATIGGRSYYSGTTGANGLSGNGRPYASTSGMNPVVTLTLMNDGTLTFSIIGGSANYTYTTPTPLEAKMDVASFAIYSTITDADRTFCMGNLSVNAEPLVVATPTFTIGSYNYEQGGYAVTPSCATEGATLTYTIGGGAATACTSGVPFYAKGGQLNIIASKDGWTSSSLAEGDKWTLNSAPSSTSPETLIPFQTSGDNGDKNIEHVYKSVTIAGGNSSAIAGIVSGKASELKLRTNQNGNTVTLNVNPGYTVTKVSIAAKSNNTGATIGLSSTTVDGGDNIMTDTKTFPISTATDPVEYVSNTISAKNNIVFTFDNSAIDGTDGKKNNQIQATIKVWYKTLVESAIEDCKAYETSAEFATAIDAESFSTVAQVYAFQSAWQIAKAKASGSTDYSKAIMNKTFELHNTNGWTIYGDAATAPGNKEKYGEVEYGEGWSQYYTGWNGRNVSQNIASLPAGTYRLTAKVYSTEGSGATVRLFANGQLSTPEAGGDHDPVLDFTVTGSEPSIKIGIGGTGHEDDTDNTWGNWWYRVKNFTLTKTGVSGTITPAGWSTFTSPYPLDLSTISGGTAYYASTSGESSVTLTPTTATVPAGEGIMIKGTPNETFTINVAASGEAIDGNLLKGQTTTGNVAASTDDVKHYVFGYVTETPATFGFYNLTSATSVEAGKAYLEITTGSTPARALRIVFGDITGVSNVEASAETQAQDGKFIENGKLVIIKNGQKFNAAGAKLY